MAPERLLLWKAFLGCRYWYKWSNRACMRCTTWLRQNLVLLGLERGMHGNLSMKERKQHVWPLRAGTLNEYTVMIIITAPYPYQRNPGACAQSYKMCISAQRHGDTASLAELVPHPVQHAWQDKADTDQVAPAP